MDLQNQDDKSLKKILLIAEINEKQRSLGIWGNISSTVALLSSMGALIAALVALNVANTDHAKKIIDAYKSKAELLESQQKLQQIKIELQNNNKQIESDKFNIKRLNSKASDLLRQANAIENAIHNSKKVKLSGVNIEVRKDDRLMYFTVNSHPSKTSVSVYYNCYDFYVFPENTPKFENCKTEFHGDFTNKITPWEFGPVTDMNRDNEYWVVVDFGTHKETRLLNLSWD